MKRNINKVLIYIGYCLIIVSSLLMIFLTSTKQMITKENNYYVVNKSESSNNKAPKDFNIFYGDALYNFANYKLNNHGDIYFNGNLDSLRKTINPWTKMNLWQNDRKSQQMVMVFDSNSDISNVTVQISGHQAATTNGVIAQINVMNFIKSTKTTGTSTISNGISYFPDKIGGNQVLNPHKFLVQPFLIKFSSYENKVIAGEYEYNIFIQYLVNGVYKTKVETITLSVSETVITKTNDFSFNAMTSPATVSTYNFNANNTEAKSNQRAVVTNKPDDTNSQYIKELYSQEHYFDWMTHHAGYFPSYLDEKYSDILQANYQYMEQMGAQYAYAPIFGNSIMRISLTNQNNYNSHEEYLTDISDLSGDWFANSNLAFSFDFDGFLKYINFAKSNGFTKIYLPTITRGSNGVKFFYNYDNNNGITSKSVGSNNATYNIVSAIKDPFIDQSGKLTSLGESYINNFIPKYFQAVLDYIKRLSDEVLTLTNGKKLQFYYSFDETSYEINTNIINKITSLDSDHLLKSHAYLGWEYTVDTDDYDDLYKKFYELFDDITIQQRDVIVKGLENENRLKNLKQIFALRKAAHKTTWLYSSWNNAPATYIASLPSEAYWGMLVAEKLGIDGFTRFAYEGYRNSITSDGDEDTGSIKEPGDAYLMYPTYYMQNTLPSMRLLNIQEGYNLVKKLRSLTSDGVISQTTYEEFLTSITFPKVFVNNSYYMFANTKSFSKDNINLTSVVGMIEYAKKYLINLGA